MAPLCSIPYLMIAEEEKHVSKSQKITWIAIAGGIVVLLTLIHVFYKPLDVMWFVILRKLGLGY